MADLNEQCDFQDSMRRESAHCCIHVNDRGNKLAPSSSPMPRGFLLNSVIAPRYPFFPGRNFTAVVIQKLRKMLLFIVISVLILPTLLSSNLASAQMPVPGPVLADAQKKALILSPIDQLSPMRFYDLNNIMYSLTQAGYAVTYVADRAVTLDMITTQLNGYDVIIWRTNVYEHAHAIYYYVGQLDSATTALSYASDFASGALDYSHGILGASIDFFYEHLSRDSLSSVKAVVLVTSMSSPMANILLNAGVKSVIYFEGIFSLQFGIVDYLTSIVVRFLASGYDVTDSVTLTMAPFLNLNLRDPLDSLSLPSLVYSGDYMLTIK